MFVRLSQVKKAIFSIDAAVTSERSAIGIDEAFTQPDEFSRLAQDPDFVESVDHAVGVFDPICKAISNLES
jgi:hypothetical protein